MSDPTPRDEPFADLAEDDDTTTVSRSRRPQGDDDTVVASRHRPNDATVVSRRRPRPAQDADAVPDEATSSGTAIASRLPPAGDGPPPAAVVSAVPGLPEVSHHRVRAAPLPGRTVSASPEWAALAPVAVSIAPAAGTLDATGDGVGARAHAAPPDGAALDRARRRVAARRLALIAVAAASVVLLSGALLVALVPGL